MQRYTTVGTGDITHSVDYRDHTCFFMHKHLPGPEEAV